MQMQVQDDGRGFDLEQVLAVQGTHFGLIGMRERVEHLGGQFEIDSSPGKGTRLSVKVPLQPRPVRKDLETLRA
jgi:signal transduction histidine kinase